MRLVLVIGVKQQIDELIRRAGSQPCFIGGYRVTDPAAMTAAAEATGAARAEVEARLSKVGGQGVCLLLQVMGTGHGMGNRICTAETLLELFRGRFLMAGLVKGVPADAVQNACYPAGTSLSSDDGFCCLCCCAASL